MSQPNAVDPISIGGSFSLVEAKNSVELTECDGDPSDGVRLFQVDRPPRILVLLGAGLGVQGAVDCVAGHLVAVRRRLIGWFRQCQVLLCDSKQGVGPFYIDLNSHDTV